MAMFIKSPRVDAWRNPCAKWRRGASCLIRRQTDRSLIVGNGSSSKHTEHYEYSFKCHIVIDKELSVLSPLNMHELVSEPAGAVLMDITVRHTSYGLGGDSECCRCIQRHWNSRERVYRTVIVIGIFRYSNPWHAILTRPRDATLYNAVWHPAN